jgi:LuxR family transcriptional regulator, maltose regulon positive regulatory protein
MGGDDVSVAAQRLRAASASEHAPRRVAKLPFELDESKVQVPALHAGTVSRTGLVNRLRASASFPVLTMTAPAGYGKTTLLAQWAVRDSRPFAWVSLDERDDDPLVLLCSVAAALHAVKPLDRSVLEALTTPSPSLWSSGIPRLASALTAFKGNLVLDDAHLLRSREAAEIVAMLADNVAAGSTLVLGGRATPALPITALRTAGKLFELGADQIALTPREGQLLLRATGADVSLSDVTELVSRCEGWPAALYLAALTLRDDEETERKGAKRMQFDTGEGNVADFLRAEYLSGLRPSALQFLRRTSVLDRMCGPVCDAVLQEQGSALELESIERSNLFLVPLDRQRVWYRYHHLFRDLLRRELAEREPELEAVLHRRAAVWYEEREDSDSALEHAWAAGDINHVARILTAIALPVYFGGRVATVERWLTGFDDVSLLERYPHVALQGSFIHVLRGRTEQAQRWLGIVERQAAGPGRSSLQPGIAAVRATMGLDGVYQMIADAESALSGLQRDHQFRPSALTALGIGYALLGQDRRADAILASAGDEAERLGATDTRVVAISERSLLAAADSDQPAAESLALEARELVEQGRLDFYPTSSMAIAASARAELRHGRWEEARALLDKSRELRSGLTHAFLPWLTLQTLIEEGQAYLAIRDVESVRSRVTEIRSLLREHPFVGVLAEQAGELERAVDAMRQGDDAARGLTGAELRLLPLLSTHLSFREIGEALFVSRNTVKTQAISVYRKLEVSSRSEAIARAVELGLIEPVT